MIINGAIEFIDLGVCLQIYCGTFSINIWNIRIDTNLIIYRGCTVKSTPYILCPVLFDLTNKYQKWNLKDSKKQKVDGITFQKSN